MLAVYLDENMSWRLHVPKRALLHAFDYRRSGQACQLAGRRTGRSFRTIVKCGVCGRVIEPSQS